jgi:hypothetical protein
MRENWIIAGLRVDQNPKQARLILLVKRVERELDAIGEELLKLCFDRVIDSSETTNRLSIARRFHRQTGGTLIADRRRLLHALNFDARVLDPLEFIDRRGAGVAGRELCVQAAQASPVTQMPFRIVCAERTGVLQCEFQ